MRGIRKVKAAILCAAILCSEAIAQSAQEDCRVGAGRAANNAVARVGEDHQIEIPEVTADSVTRDIAAQVCDQLGSAGEARVTEVAAATAAEYFESALKLGRATEVPALVKSAINKTLGLKLPDFRRYGMISVSCASGSAQVFVREAVSRCGSRVLLQKGELDITVRESAMVLCTASTSVLEREEKSCDCAPAVGMALPVKMECK